MAKEKRGNADEKELSLKNEIFAVFSLFFSFFLIFSLASFTPLDPSFFHSAPMRVVTNYGGRLGSELSALLFNIFGFASLLFILIFLFLTAYFLFNRRINRAVSKGVGFGILLFSLSALLANLHPETLVSGQALQTGGMVGLLLNNLVSSQIRGFFASLLFLSLLGISLVLIAKVSIRNIIVLLWRLLARGGALLGVFFRKRLEGMRRNRNRRKVQEKYEAGQGNFVFKGKQQLKEPLRDREPSPRSEKRALIKKPSKLPEESGIFPEMEQEFQPDAQYKPPPLTYLDAPTEKSQIDIDELEDKKQELSQRLQEFKINGEIAEYTPGPVITTFEFVPAVGVKVKDVVGLTEDLAMVAKAQYVRIERILGKNAIGIEIPNKKRETIHLRELLETPQYKQSSSPLTLALGKTATGDIFISDLKEMPHLLIAGATGSGKSVAIHSIILSILYKSSPKSVKFIMIDPKRIELAIYNSLPHLLTPVVVNPKLAKNALDWAVFEMENRYKKLATLQVRNIEQYNKKLELLIQSEADELEQLEDKEPIPYIVIIIDELADLMMASAREIEDDVMRLAQKARAIGIHLILATQRPSIDVITGNIKNNFPSRMALAVPSRYDSRTIIDQVGAEKLLGNGDMLFLPPKTASLIRLHSAYVSEPETVRVSNFLSKQAKPEFNTQIVKHAAQREEPAEEQVLDELFFEAAETIISTGQASTSYLQRKLSVGFARAGRIIDQLQEKGVISPANSKNQREILMTLDDLNALRKE
ncbi:MAG: DNA translocase FtsK 4TM domain-containing protein [Acidobacteria bacterium]|jgi:S-DNA-T family DNA segregation ATPase FtsK/SpoIIIE|nr:DNA translocase FtsK 4TM domain-containing protein [Acidobacteriota bacterium]